MNETSRPDQAAVRVESLTRKFDDFTAVDSVSFDVARGEIFGFLGPNGAGKSTTIRMLCGIIEPTSGSGTVEGYSVAREQDKIKMITGYMSQKFSLYDDLTPTENLEFFSGVYGLRGGERRDRVEWALSTSNLLDRRDDLTGNLAAGLKQRLALSAAILHKPSILFLDEPTAGIDPLSRRSFWDLIYEMSSAGVTIFVTTHYMDEAEHCDRVAFINRGRLIDLDTPTRLKNIGVKGIVYELALTDWHQGFDLLRSSEDRFGRVSLFGKNIHIDFIGDSIEDVRSSLAGVGVEILTMREISPSLEDAFVALLYPEESETPVR